MKRNIHQYMTHDPAICNEITELFYASIHVIDPTQYSRAQQHAWAPLPIDYTKWENRLLKSKPYYVTVEGHVAGFIELEMSGYIDCFYVHPQFQRQGIAAQLYSHIEKIAHQHAMLSLLVDASTVIKPLFENWGFVVIQENRITRGAQSLVNFTMKKRLI